MKLSIRDLCVGAVIASIYVVLTMLLPINIGMMQFRLSEALVLICFYNKKYIFPLTVGCCIANFFLFGMLDVVVGGASTLIALFLLSKSKNLWIGAIYPVLFSIFVALEMSFLNNNGDLSLSNFTWEIFWTNTFYVVVAQFISCYIIGISLFKVLEKNKSFMNLIESNRDEELL